MTFIQLPLFKLNPGIHAEHRPSTLDIITQFDGEGRHLFPLIRINLFLH